MGLCYLTFMGRNLGNGKKLKLVQIMKNVNTFTDNVVVDNIFSG